MGLFGKIKEALKKTRANMAQKLRVLFSKNKLGNEFYDELEEILISEDVSVTTAEDVVEQVREEAIGNRVKDEKFVTDLLKDILEDKLNEAEPPEFRYPLVIMFVGVNGVGKTTTIGKVANWFTSHKKSVTVAAADTFRAAASDQLNIWADRAKVRIVKHEEGSDPAAVIYDAVSSAKARGTDVVLVDTAGRLHVKENLMNELKKMDRVVTREFAEAQFLKFLVLDATTGQNAVRGQESAEAFAQSSDGQTFEQPTEQTAEPSGGQPNEAYGQTEGQEEGTASDEEFVFSSSDTDGNASSDEWNGEWPTDSE